MLVWSKVDPWQGNQARFWVLTRPRGFRLSKSALRRRSQSEPAHAVWAELLFEEGGMRAGLFGARSAAGQARAARPHLPAPCSWRILRSRAKRRDRNSYRACGHGPAPAGRGDAQPCRGRARFKDTRGRREDCRRQRAPACSCGVRGACPTRSHGKRGATLKESRPAPLSSVPLEEAATALCLPIRPERLARHLSRINTNTSHLLFAPALAAVQQQQQQLGSRPRRARRISGASARGPVRRAMPPGSFSSPLLLLSRPLRNAPCRRAAGRLIRILPYGVWTPPPQPFRRRPWEEECSRAASRCNGVDRRSRFRGATPSVAAAHSTWASRRRVVRAKGRGSLKPADTARLQASFDAQ